MVFLQTRRRTNRVDNEKDAINSFIQGIWFLSMVHWFASKAISEKGQR